MSSSCARNGGQLPPMTRNRRLRRINSCPRRWRL
ncbi:hypothetical protein GAN17_09075 [Mycobacterium kubicae]|nr:hypothetical protein GAN17_09075 [Mycobacterium kubicae]